MPQYRRKPTVTHAEEFNPGKYFHPAVEVTQRNDGVAVGWRIMTAEGWAVIRPGDMIITGVNGTVYPCKPIHFEELYEPVEEVPTVADVLAEG